MTTNANRLVLFILLLGIIASGAMFFVAFDSYAIAKSLISESGSPRLSIYMPYIAYGLTFLAVTLALCGIVEYCYKIVEKLDNSGKEEEDEE